LRTAVRPVRVSTSFNPPGGQALGVGEPEQVVARAPARRQGGRVEQRAELAERVLQLPVGLAVDQGGALVGGVEAADDAHGGRLARAVRADEAGDLPGVDRERHAVKRLGPAEPLAEPGHFDRCFHVGQR